MAKKIVVVQQKRGCLWLLGMFFLVCLLISLLVYAACIAAGVGLWFLARYCWRKLVEQAPDSKFVKRMSSVPRIVRQVLTGVVCACVTLVLMGGLASGGSSRDDHSAQSVAATQAATTSVAAVAPATMPAATTAGPETPALDQLVVRFVDVGQGDATVVEFPDGKTLLVDTPTGEAGTVKAQLAADGRNSIDWLVATHPDADHIGGLDTIISSMDVGSVWAPERNSSTQTFTRFLEAVDAKGLSIEPCYAGRQIATGDNYAIDLLWPEQGASYGEDNDYSAIIKVTYGQNAFLLTGDAPVEAQERCGAGHVDVLKVAHHGSASGMDASLASALSPSIAVLSYGENSYGHPTQVVLDALAGVGSQVFGTRVNGTVTVTSDGSQVSASVEHDGAVEAASQDSGKSSKSLSSADAADSTGGDDGSGSSSAAENGGQTVTGDTDAEDVVYVTASGKGKKYHRQGCSSLSNSSGLVAMSRSEAEAQGYGPCKRCKP